MGGVTVVVATFGSDEWAELAQERAIPSAERQAPTIHVHGDTLAESRNRGLARVKTPFVIHLDADDELTEGYVETLLTGQADIRAPSVQYVKGGRPRQPYVPNVWGHHHDCTADCLEHGNYIVIGAMARAQLLRDVGGWRDFDWSEDWDLWLRCHLAGGSFETIPAAVYRAHVRDDSRNRAPNQQAKLAAHQAIYAANYPERVAA